MLQWLAEFQASVPALNVFRYITFRTGGAIITALLFVFMFGPAIIAMLRLKQGKGQPIRSDGPQSHLITKKGTPTMGGLMIFSGLMVATLLWANLSNPYVWVVLFVTIGFGLIGFYDDYLKVTKQTHNGLSGKTRLAIEALIAGSAAVVIMHVGREPLSSSLAFPFFKDLLDRPLLVLRDLRRLRHRRRRQCGEPHRRPRRPRHRAGHGRRRLLRADLVPVRQRAVRGLSADPLRRRRRRTGGDLRRHHRRGHRLPLVQRPAGADLHGRHRLAGAWAACSAPSRSPPSTRSCWR